MDRTALFITTGLGAGSIVGLLSLAGALTWALIGSAFGFSSLNWGYLEDQEGQTV